MWRVWLLFDPRRTLIALITIRGSLDLLLVFFLLSTARFNWLEGAHASQATSVSQQSPTPSPSR